MKNLIWEVKYLANKKTGELDQLFLQIGTYRRSDEFKQLLEFVRKFPRIAPYNAMLLHMQKPGTQYVATVNEWWDRFRRWPKPGSRPLVILRPFGPVTFVFELGDTMGDQPFPSELLNPFEVKGHLQPYAYQTLTEYLKCEGIFFTEVENGTARAGSIKRSDGRLHDIIVSGNKEHTVKILFELLVNRTHPIETRFATILHELGHLYCGHLGTPNEKWWQDRRGLDLKVEEFEAECICWLVCERLGIQNPSAEYLSGYLEDNDQIPPISIDTVLKSVSVIEAMINGNKEPRKELIVSTRELSNRRKIKAVQESLL